MPSAKDNPLLEEKKPSAINRLRTSALVAMNSVRKKGFSDEYKSYESTSNSLRNSILVVLAYILTGTITFSVWMEDWTVIDAMYFTSVTFTTVGYGDLYLVSRAQRLWGTIFVFLGIIVLGGIALGIIFDRLIDTYDMISKDIKSGTYQHYLHLFDGKSTVKNERTNMVKESGKVTFYVLPMLIVLLLPALLIGYFEQWSILKSLYFFAITATTVGYGDVSPQSQISRVVASIYLPFCVAIMTWILGEYSGVYIKHKRESLEEEFLNRQLTRKDLLVMDTDGDGSVSYGEFLAFMLNAMGKVEKYDLQQIKSLYQRLDSDQSNSLTVDDIYNKVHDQTVTEHTPNAKIV